MFASPPPKCSKPSQRITPMPDPNEELVYEEKIDRITEQLEELMLDALMAALGKIRERNELFSGLEKASAENRPGLLRSNIPLERGGSSNLRKSRPVQNNQKIAVHLLRGYTCLTELRLLQSACFDSESLLFTILCGDGRLPERFRTPELLQLGSRIRTRLQLPALSPEQMEDYLNFALIQAGHPQLMSPELISTLAAHALNNLRVLNHMAAELLTAAAQRNLPRIDESLYFELFAQTTSKPRRVKSSQPSITA